jgi:hypothetical protein
LELLVPTENYPYLADIAPQEGFGATLEIGGESFAGTIMTIEPTGTELTWRKDHAVYQDVPSAWPPRDEWTFESDSLAEVRRFTRRADGSWRESRRVHSGVLVTGVRVEEHYDTFGED